MTGVTTLKRQILGDASWLVIVALAALAVGLAIDQGFRRPALGLRYVSAAQKMTAELPQSIEQLGVEEVAGIINRSSAVVLDARPRVFYEMGHLPGARSLSREEFDKDFALLEAELRADGRTLLVYCADVDCEDGAIVARALQTKGMRSVSLFPGGFAEWEASGNTVEALP